MDLINGINLNGCEIVFSELKLINFNALHVIARWLIYLFNMIPQQNWEAPKKKPKWRAKLWCCVLCISCNGMRRYGRSLVVALLALNWWAHHSPMLIVRTTRFNGGNERNVSHNGKKTKFRVSILRMNEKKTNSSSDCRWTDLSHTHANKQTNIMILLHTKTHYTLSETHVHIKDAMWLWVSSFFSIFRSFYNLYDHIQIIIALGISSFVRLISYNEIYCS